MMRWVLLFAAMQLWVTGSYALDSPVTLTCDAQTTSGLVSFAASDTSKRAYFIINITPTQLSGTSRLYLAAFSSMSDATNCASPTSYLSGPCTTSTSTSTCDSVTFTGSSGSKYLACFAGTPGSTGVPSLNMCFDSWKLTICPSTQVTDGKGGCCTPNCGTTKICGSDGCSGSCGPCSTTCSTDQTRCGASCTTSTDCSTSTQACVKGVCGSCTEDSQCLAKGLFCSSGQCKSCSVDSDCGVGYTCVKGSVCGTTCTSNSDCTNGLACMSGVSTTTKGCAACSQNSDCSSPNVCVSGKCTTCSTNSDCGTTGKTCKSGTCYSSCTSTASCTGGLVCSSDSICTSCNSNSDCSSSSAGNACISNVCASCNKDSQCNLGQSCSGGTCVTPLAATPLTFKSGANNTKTFFLNSLCLLLLAFTASFVLCCL